MVQVWDGVVAAPLIGTLDNRRTEQFMERLLQRIVETNSPVDITGVPTFDTQTAQRLVETITAVRMLGAQVVLTGVRPALAQTLVHLGIDLSNIVTRASLSAGVRVAMEILDLLRADRGGDRADGGAYGWTHCRGGHAGQRCHHGDAAGFDLGWGPDGVGRGSRPADDEWCAPRGRQW
jgi:anti-anti-sigma regulatory factor